VQNASLHGTLHGIIYMDLSPGIIDRGEHCMSTQQIPLWSQTGIQTWFSTFSHVIKSVGFQPSKTDYSLFTRQNNSSFTALLIYVDDILLTENSAC